MSQKIKTLYDDVFLNKEGVVKQYTNPDGGVTLLKVAEPCQVESSIENIDTGEVSVKLRYKTVGEIATIQTLVTPAETISSTNKIEILANNGLDVNGENKKILICYLRKSREKAPYRYQHNKVGFSRYHNQLIFKHQESVGLQNIKGIKEESHYVGPLNIKPMGSYDNWLETIKDYVLGNPALELALILGFSAPVIGYIGDQLGIESLFFHIYGNSSSGKTTACFIATASFGSPNTREGGLIQSWNTTMNALQATIADNRGVPMVFDECSMSNVSDYTNLIYSIGEGREKARMGADLELRKSRTWMTTILSTGEMSLLEKANKNIGLKARDH